MKVEKIRKKDYKLELLVELSPAETAEEMQRIAVFEIRKNGFAFDESNGKSPVDFVREKLGDIESAFVFDEGIMRHRASFALTAAQIDAIGTPVYRCSEHAVFGKPFKYQLVCIPVPDYELNDYGPVSISVPSNTVKDGEIEAEIQRMAQSASVSVTDESHDTVVKGDRVELAMRTTMAGEVVKPLCSDKREYATGTLSMPDDFDEAIIGMKVGETKTFSFLGPDLALDENGNVKMDEYETTVTVNRIVSSKAPAIDDAWAKTVNPNVSTLEELREHVARKLSEKHEADLQRMAITLAGNELSKRLVGEIPDIIYGAAIKEARESLARELQDLGMTKEQYLSKQDITQEQLNNALMMQVRTQLTRQFALNAYADHKGLVVDEDDLNAFFESIAPGKANYAHADFKRDGRMYAARCAARRLKAGRRAVQEADVKRI